MRAHNRGEDAILAPVNRKARPAGAAAARIARLPAQYCSRLRALVQSATRVSVSCMPLRFPFQRGRMLRLVESHFAAPGNLHSRDQAPALVFYLAGEFDLLGF
jgi:hypothetical protein